MLTGKQRAFLRARATELECTVQIGKAGVTENLLLTIEQALDAHEMVKVKCLENCGYDPREASDGICEAIGAEGVQCIGTKFVLFRISPEHRRYDLDKLCEIEEKKTDAKKAVAKKADAKKKAPAPGSPRGSSPARPGERKTRPGYTVNKKTK